MNFSLDKGKHSSYFYISMRAILASFCRGFAVAAMFGQISFAASVISSSTLWTPLGANYDFLGDQQTGARAGDIVGNGVDFGFFTTFNPNATPTPTNGELGFRVRLDAAGGNSNNPAFDRVFWVGIDAGLNGTLDAFVGVIFSGNSSELTIRAPGTGANTSPSTTTISNTPSNTYATSASNYNYRPVNFGSGLGQDGGSTNDLTPLTTSGPDYYLSFMLPFADIVEFMASLSTPITITNSTPLRYVMATSTQANSLNQDLGGVNAGTNSATSWQDLGGFSPVITPTGVIIPEPSGVAFLIISGSLFLLRRGR